MKAILINERGIYSHLNGHTFDVAKTGPGNYRYQLTASFVALLIPDEMAPTGFATVDTLLKNVLIVNAQAWAKAFRQGAKNEVGTPYWNYSKIWSALENWAAVHNIQLP